MPVIKSNIDCKEYVSKKILTNKVFDYNTTQENKFFIARPEDFFMNTNAFLCPFDCMVKDSKCYNKLEAEDNVKICEPKGEDCKAENNFWLYARTDIFDGYS